MGRDAISKLKRDLFWKEYAMGRITTGTLLLCVLIGWRVAESRANGRRSGASVIAWEAPITWFGQPSRIRLADLRRRPIADVLREGLIEELLGRGFKLRLDPSSADGQPDGTVLDYSPGDEFESGTEVVIGIAFSAKTP